MIKYIIVFITLIILIFLFILSRKKINSNSKKYIYNILKSYDSILIKKNSFEYKDKEKVYVKNIDDLIKMSYELNKKIYYISSKNLFILEDTDYLIYNQGGTV